MLLNQGIRTKLLTVLALPILVLVIVAGVVSAQAFDQAGRARQVEQLAKGSGVLGTLVASLQAERTVSVAYLQKRPVAAELKKSWASTDAALAASRILIGSVDLATLSPQATAAVAQADRAHAGLAELRASVREGFAESPTVAGTYAEIISADIALPRRIGEGLGDRVIGGQLATYSAAQNLSELATQGRENGLAVIGAGVVDSVSGAALAKTTALQNETVASYRLDATRAQAAALDTALFQPVARRAAFRDLEQTMLAAGNGGRIKLNSSDWRNVANDRIGALQDLSGPIAVNAGQLAGDSATSASVRAYGVLAGGGLLVALLVLLGLVFSRTITRPLRALTAIAGQVRDELPLMVERMATPGQGPGVSLPEIPDGGSDEVGQLARAFRDVNATTVRVAEEQAALRASIAEMFVNVARRNHVLLSRQLSFIDQLERTEENPDTLENLFKLDHLATRMRRNAESLIVLAGIDAGRRLRRPMPLSDVLRTAVSEIERYDRVDLALQADPPMVGHVALTSAHLMAELLENATQFSNPDTRVITSTAFSSRGVRVTITDLGLGMTWDEITDANERIANPPTSDVVGSQRLGFYVVGRLARRLDATVEIKAGRAQGTIVTIDLPPALFVAGTVIELPAADEPVDELDVDAAPAEAANADATTAVSGTAAAAPADVIDRSVDPPARTSALAQRGSAPPVTAPTRGRLPDATGGRRPDVAAKAEVPAETVDGAASRVPLLPAPFPHQVAEPEPAPEPAAGSLLPRRGAAAPTSGPGMPMAPPVPAAAPSSAPAPTPAPEGLAAPAGGQPRTGIFSGFRARREATPPAVAPPVLRALPPVEDSATTFVPVIEPAAPTSVPDLPRGDLPKRDSGRREPASVDLPSAPPAGVDLTSVPGPLDAGWVPVVDDEQPEQLTVADLALVPEPVAVVVPQPEAVAVVIPEPEPVAVVIPEPEPVAVVIPEPEPVAVVIPEPEPDVAPEPGPEPVPVITLEPIDPEPANDLPQRSAPAPVGLAAMDILPSHRGGRSLRLRRPGRSAAPVVSAPRVAVPSPGRHAAPVAAPTSEASTSPSRSTSPIVSPFAELGAESAVNPVAPAAVSEPIPAPPSLFTTAPDASPFGDPAFATAPVVAEPAVPALSAAQSLRERSAMASEALSELSALSAYRPEALQSAPAGLVRRTPRATAAGQLPPPEETVGAGRPNRNAADVRSMLSGFQAGVERGRTSPAAGTPTGGDAG